MRSTHVILIFSVVLIASLIQCKKTALADFRRTGGRTWKKIDSVIINYLKIPFTWHAGIQICICILDTVIDEIINSRYIRRESAFSYHVRIIRNDELYAFVCPGGYLYFYTGLINYLNTGAQFTGLIAHLIAHVDRRHITEILSRNTISIS